MKLLAIAALLAASGFAAPWDGTKGNITVSTTGNVVTITSTDSAFGHFLVTVSYKSNLETGPRALSMTAFPWVPIGGGPSKLLLFIPESDILMLSISEIKVGQTQWFIGNIPSWPPVL